MVELVARKLSKGRRRRKRNEQKHDGNLEARIMLRRAMELQNDMVVLREAHVVNFEAMQRTMAAQ